MLKMKALMLTYQIWMRIASLPAKDQPQAKNKYYPMYVNACPCCDYVKKLFPTFSYYCTKDEFLDGCPMRGAWPEKCEGGNSPYVKWQDGLINSRTKYARQIAEKALELWKEETW